MWVSGYLTYLVSIELLGFVDPYLVWEFSVIISLNYLSAPFYFNLSQSQYIGQLEGVPQVFGLCSIFFIHSSFCYLGSIISSNLSSSFLILTSACSNPLLNVSSEFFFIHITVYFQFHYFHLGFPDGSGIKNLPANAGDVALIPGSGISPGRGNGNPLQYSCLENSMDRGAWQNMGSQRVRHDWVHTHTFLFGSFLEFLSFINILILLIYYFPDFLQFFVHIYF